MNTYRYLNNQIADHFITTIIAHSGKYQKKIPKNIQQEHKFRKLNILTANETPLITK